MPLGLRRSDAAGRRHVKRLEDILLKHALKGLVGDVFNGKTEE